jgi:hypothetical protein
MKYNTREEFFAAAAALLPAGPVQVVCNGHLQEDSMMLIIGSPALHVGKRLWQLLQLCDHGPLRPGRGCPLCKQVGPRPELNQDQVNAFLTNSGFPPDPEKS